MKLQPLVPFFAALFASVAAFADGASPASPWEMAAATERWMADGAGARFLSGMDAPARDADSLAFVDETWLGP